VSATRAWSLPNRCNQAQPPPALAAPDPQPQHRNPQAPKQYPYSTLISPNSPSGSVNTSGQTVSLKVDREGCCYARRRAGNWSPAAEHNSRGRRGSFRRSSLSPRAFTVDCFYVRVDRSSELAEYERRNRQACPERDDQHQRNRDVEAGQCIDGQDGPRGHAHEQQTCTVVGQQVEGEQPLCGRRLRNGGIGCPVIVVGYPRLILNTKPRAQVWCIQRPIATKMRSIRSNTVPCG